MALVPVVLSCNEKDIATNDRMTDAGGIVSPEVAAIADKTYADKYFSIIEETYLRQLRSALSSSNDEVSESIRSTQKIPIGKQLNQHDVNVLAKSNHFKDAAEFTDYFVKFSRILGRYSFYELPDATANQVMKSLERKCLSNSYAFISCKYHLRIGAFVRQSCLVPGG